MITYGTNPGMGVGITDISRHKTRSTKKNNRPI
jgi:hypothetical protein